MGKRGGVMESRAVLSIQVVVLVGGRGFHWRDEFPSQEPMKQFSSDNRGSLCASRNTKLSKAEE
jgi:hypothetical protein